MHKWSDSPIVTFSRDGQAIELGRSGDAPVLHLNGSEGLGIAPVEVEKADRIAGDGSVVRGVRYGDREVFIPMLVEQPTTGDLNLWRRELNRLLAPVPGDPEASLVDVQIDDPTTGTVRTVRGIYTGGLEGDFGTDFHGSWQTLGVQFDCTDPWWLGPERTSKLQLNPGSKPFLSETEPFFPVILAESVVQGDWTINVEGDGLVWPTWEVTGPGTDLRIIRGNDHIEIDGEVRAGETLLIDTATGRMTPDRWDDTSFRTDLFPLHKGRNRLQVSMVGATVDTVVRLVYRERWLEGI